MKIVLFPSFASKPLRLLAMALMFLSVVSARGAEDEARVAFAGSIGKMPVKAGSTVRALNSTATARTVNFSVALRMRNFSHLQERIARGELVSAEEMDLAYLPLPNDYAAVKKWLVSEGFTITTEDTSRLSVFARGTVAQIQSSLRTTMVGVTVEGVEYPSASTAPSLPASIAAPVLGINGLQTFHLRHKNVIRHPNSGANGTFMINDILTTYGAKNLGVTGKNQTIAILIDTAPASSDLTKFWTNNGVAQSLSNITTINVNGGTLPAVSGEETLDVEWTSGIAPDAKIRIYATGDLTDTALDAGISRIISDVGTDATIHQLSISLGAGETYEASSQLDTDDQYFTTLASKGVSTFVSSGDAGSTPDENGNDGGPIQPESYASDPMVTGVGGTTINVNTSDVRTSELAWVGSGGGVSQHFAKPSWQTGTGVPSGTKRFVPDVSMPADPNTGAYVYVGGAPDVYGGTSWSAPTWAGFSALINEARAKAGKTGGIGLLNPSVYPLIGTGNFHDITSGNNAAGANAGGKYVCTAGYDEVTGIGVPVMSVLTSTLSGAVAATPTITSFTPTSGPVGTSIVITGTNFTSVSGVTIHGQSASFTVNSATQITARVSNGTTTGVIKVTTSAGSATSSTSFTVTTTTVPAPTITSFTPTTGPVGTSVTITGTNFTNTSAVVFNTTSAAYTVVSATQITTTVPAGATTGAVKVTTPGGMATSTASFTVTGGGGSTSGLVISQVYGGSGSASATYANDYVELYNPTAAAVNVSTYSVQYASAKKNTWAVTTLTGSIAPGHYFLVAEASGTSGAALPKADVQGTTAMSGTAGKVALVSSTTAITGPTSAGVVDFVGYGTTANAFEGTGPAPAPSATTADLRAGNGKTDTNNNAADFTAGVPNPRNSSTVVAPSAPVITSVLTASATTGAPFTYQITASNNPTRFGVQGLPAGLSVNGTTGVLSGTPNSAGTLKLTLNAYNAAGKGSATLTLTITAGAAPVVTSAATASGAVGAPFSYQITATNSPTTYGVQGLPAGLTVGASTGVITGTPKTAGTFTLTLNVYNAAGKGSATLTLTIAAQGSPVITSAKTASGKIGVAFSYQIVATNDPTTYGVQGLPAGLTIGASTGLISGTPKGAGTITMTLNVYNASGKGSADLTLTVTAK